MDKFIGMRARHLESEGNDGVEDEEVEGEYLTEKDENQDYRVLC